MERIKPTSDREACFAIDAEQQVVMWPPAVEDLLGFQAGQALGRPCWQTLKGSDIFGRPLCCEQCRACLQSTACSAPPAHHFLIRNNCGKLVRLVHELVPLPSGPGARALVLLSEAPAQRPQLPAEASGAEEPLCRPGTFGDIVKGLALLGLVSDSMYSSTFYQTLDSSLDRILAQTMAEAAEVFLLDRSSGQMCLTAHRGLFRSAFCQITRFDVNEGFPGLVAATGRPLVTRELFQDDRFIRTRVKEKRVRSFISTPLRSDRGIIGCLNVASRRYDGRLDNHLQLLSWLASPLASASELAMLRSQGRVDWLEESEFGALAGQVLNAMTQVAEADHGLISLWQPDGSGIHCETSSRNVVPCPAQWSSHQCPARKQGRPLIVPGPGASVPAPCLQSLDGARQAICMPLGPTTGTIGVVSVRFLKSQPVPTRPLALLGAMARTSGRVLREAWPNTGQSLQPVPPTPAERRQTDGVSYRPATLPVIEREAQKREEPVRVNTPSVAPYVDIRCFGRFQVSRDGNALAPSDFGRRQSLTVLKILVTRRGRPVSTEFLSEALWPDAEPDTTDRRLWVIVHSLRKGLEPELKNGSPSHFVNRSGDAYVFDPRTPHRIDVAEFLRAVNRGESAEAKGDPRAAADLYQQAARLYRGDFMEDEPYSDWCSPEREYLREVFLDVLKRLASLHALWKEWDRSTVWHRRALLVDNLREEVHRELMRCLRNAGRRDEALRQYMECRQILSRELGVEPLPETARLYQEILEQNNG